MKSIGLIIFCIFLLSCTNEETVAEMSDDELLIRQKRELINQAIASHDPLHIGDSWTEDFSLITSTDVSIVGKQENIESFTNHFKDRPDVVYVRTPDQIKIFDAWGVASENGYWEGSWSDGDGKIEIGGTYYAKWHKVNDQWLLRAEVYTPTHCAGGTYCDGLNN